MSCENIKKPTIKVYHKNLKLHDPENSIYKVECPFCEIGIFLLSRNNNLRLEKIDRCLNCGQAVEYLDIDEMRKVEGNV